MMFIKLRLNLKLPSAILEADKITYVYKTCDLGKRGKWVKPPKSQDWLRQLLKLGKQHNDKRWMT